MNAWHVSSARCCRPPPNATSSVSNLSFRLFTLKAPSPRESRETQTLSTQNRTQAHGENPSKWTNSSSIEFQNYSGTNPPIQFSFFILTFRELNGFYVSFSKPRFGYCFAMFGCLGNANKIARFIIGVGVAKKTRNLEDCYVWLCWGGVGVSSFRNQDLRFSLGFLIILCF